MSAQPKLLKSKFYWIALLYFTEGFPLGMFYDVFPVYFRQQGVELRDIGVLSLLGLAWTLKFLWAPAIDHYRRHRWWMAGADLCMGAVMLVFAMHAGFGPWVWLAIGAFTIFSATNDIAIDGYTIELLNRDELGLANGVRIGFYRVGMLASGVVLALSDWVKWSGAYLVVVGIFIASAIGVLCAPREQVRAVRVDRSRGLLHDLVSQPFLAGGLAAFAVFVILLIVIEVVRKGLDFVWVFALGATEIGCLFLCAALFRAAARRHALQDIERSPLLAGLMELFSRPYILPTLAFILLFKLGDAAMGFMVKPFWVDAGFSATEIGLVSVNIGLALSIAGGVAGGWYTDRTGIFKALWVLGLFQALSNLGYAIAAYYVPYGAGVEPLLWHRAVIYTASAMESFTGGLGTAAFLAFLMAIVDKRHSATEYALLSSVFALSRSVAGWASGFGAQAMGFAPYFFVTFLLSFPAYLLLLWAKRMLQWSEQNEAETGDSVKN